MDVLDFRGDPDRDIKGLAYDSRSVEPGFLFVAMKGHKQDGHVYIREAVEKGAVAVVAEKWMEGDEHIAFIRVSDAHQALSTLAITFYDQPFRNMTLVGITGTNGKTTTSYLLESVLQAAGFKSGVIGTINYRFSGHVLEAPVTTPESLEFMKILRRMADDGVTHVVMEVSSHALDQGRVRGCPFHVAIFTNLSRDHLDYHGSMEAYWEAKSRLFRNLKEQAGNRARAVINRDDPRGKDLMDRTDAPTLTYGLKKGCDVRAEKVQVSRLGLKGRLITPAGIADIRCPLIGEFNIYNIMAASAAALAMGIDLKEISTGILSLKGVPGRLEMVRNARSLTILVDYAHTPDALLKALQAVRPIVEGRLFTVFGCGGDRDKGKRGQMGRVAGEHSDLVFITSDNPRTEEPSRITSQIEEGVIESGLRNLEGAGPGDAAGRGYILDPDRASAIRRAIAMARPGDTILIAGKGHEDYQIVGKTKRHFDDREVAAEAASQGI